MAVCLSVCWGWGLRVQTCASLSLHAFFCVYTAHMWMGPRTTAHSLGGGGVTWLLPLGEGQQGMGV